MTVLTITRARGKNQRFIAHSELGLRILRAIAQTHITTN